MIGFLASDKPREIDLACAFVDGCRNHGIDAEVLYSSDDIAGYKTIGMVGVKSRDAWQACLSSGVTPIMFDKGYVRHKTGADSWLYWRVSVGSHNPTRYLMDVDRPSDRFDALHLGMKPWRSSGDHILLAGSSEKCHRFYGMVHPTEWAEGVIGALNERQSRKIYYRPKPSWRAAIAIDGSVLDRSPSIGGRLAKAYALVTHSSNACFEATLAGVPCVVLGGAVAKPIAATSLDEIGALPRPDRAQWLANLAYCQWTLDEFASGEAWETIRGQL